MRPELDVVLRDSGPRSATTVTVTRTPNILGADGAWLLQWTQRRAVLYRLSRRMELKSLALQKGTFSPLDDRDAVIRRPSLLAGASRVF